LFGRSVGDENKKLNNVVNRSLRVFSGQLGRREQLRATQRLQPAVVRPPAASPLLWAPAPQEALLLSAELLPQLLQPPVPPPALVRVPVRQSGGVSAVLWRRLAGRGRGRAETGREPVQQGRRGDGRGRQAGGNLTKLFSPSPKVGGLSGALFGLLPRLGGPLFSDGEKKFCNVDNRSSRKHSRRSRHSRSRKSSFQACRKGWLLPRPPAADASRRNDERRRPGQLKARQMDR
jgi:hypothetical protein